jgi:hypothetical protein
MQQQQQQPATRGPVRVTIELEEHPIIEINQEDVTLYLTKPEAIRLCSTLLRLLCPNPPKVGMWERSDSSNNPE